VRVADNLRMKADGVVLFPNAYEGNLVHYFLPRNGSGMVNIPISITTTVIDWEEIISVEHKASGFFLPA